MRGTLLFSLLLLALLLPSATPSRRIRADDDLLQISNNFVFRALKAINSRNAEEIGKLFFDDVVFVTCRKPKGIQKEAIVETLVNLSYSHAYFVQLKNVEPYFGKGYDTLKMTVEMNVFPGSDTLELYVLRDEKGVEEFVILTGQQVGCK